MPNRDIKESCRTSETLAKLTHGAERLFWRLTTYADDWGRFPASAAVLRAHCFALLLSTVSEGDVVGWLHELQREGLARLYTASDGKTYGEFVTWRKHQRVRAKHSKYPAPTSADIRPHMPADAPVVTEETENTVVPETPGPTSSGAPAPARVPRKRSARPNTAIATIEPPGFGVFWAAYPRKAARLDALRAWTKLDPTPELLERILAAIEAQRVWPSWVKDGGEFIPYPATWLRGEGWNDQRPTPSTGPHDGSSAKIIGATRQTAGNAAAIRQFVAGGAQQ